MKIDLSATNFKVGRGGSHLIVAALAATGDKANAKRLLMETAFLLREGKEIPEITRLVMAKHMERIALSEPRHFFGHDEPHRTENRSQKIEVFAQVEKLKESKEAKSTWQASKILSNTIYHWRSARSIQDDHKRGKELFEEIIDELKNSYKNK